MNKKLLLFFLLIALLLWASMHYGSVLQRPVNELFNAFKSRYVATLDYIHKSIDAHFFQAQTIKELKKQLRQCSKDSLLLQAYKEDLAALEALVGDNRTINPSLKLARVLSYARFGDMNKYWLDVNEYNGSKIYGLIHNGNVAGIVINKDEMPLALTIRDPKCSYAVRIGKAKAPGIARGNSDRYIIVTYIPTWYKINVGDEVQSSGLDGLFFAGLKVGKVVSLSTSGGYQKAVVEPYYGLDTPIYFYMIQKVR